MRGSRRFVSAALALTCAATVLAGCADTVRGSGTVGRQGTSGAPGNPSSSPTGFPSSVSPSAAGAALPSYLVPAPAGSVRGTSAWARTTAPTVQQFVAQFYDAGQVTGEVSRLHTYGITGIAHNLWISDQLQLDVVLLQFTSAAGAIARHSGVITATTGEPDLRSTRPAIQGDVTEFYATKIDKYGNIASRAYAVKGDVAIEVFCFSPKTFAQAYLSRYTGEQVVKLP
ncbi:hypothetical protein [uncultured Jatrophihabitans sp.]|uniref:hypothetical protein n=1 Tax=uncultured Jatrophihabitans sp. TaxID=1610747 RepID=UPI0035CAB676